MATPLSQYNKKCIVCGKMFMTHYICQHFCSKECAYKNGKKKLKQDKRNNPQKYIDRKKKYKINKIKKAIANNIRILSEEIIICKICKKEFVPNSGGHLYCSNKCRQEKDRLKYYDDIKKNGREKRNKIWNKNYRKRAGYEPVANIKCVICGLIFKRKTIRQVYCKNNECKLEYLRKKSRISGRKNVKKILERRKNNINYCIMNKLRMRISCAVKSQGTYKAMKTTSLIGCSVAELKIHLENQFTEGMTWSNYGFYGWHIDHIKPCASFDLTKKDQQIKCFNYKNLQPLWARDNLQKSCKV